MPMLIRTHIQLAKESLARNRMRCFLTCLGIGVGVASVILILSLTGSINNLIDKQINTNGSDLVVVRPKTHKSTIDAILEELMSTNQYLKSNLTLEDVKTVSEMPDVVAAAPLAVSAETVAADISSEETRVVDSATIVGTNEALLSISNLKLKSGNFISGKVKNTAVIGKDLSLELFGTGTEAVGKTFTMLGQKFIVVGLLEEIDDPINFNNVDFDRALLVSADFLKTLDSNLQIQQINVQATSTGSLASLSDQIANKLKETKAGDKNFAVAYGEQISHPAGGLFSIISAMLTVVAGISLIVGGIGVMNIMLVSVSERTREIGIRKAVGASGLNIWCQFLFESLILSLMGGAMGMVIGYVAAFLISIETPFAPYINMDIVWIAVGMSLLTGTVFGLYPAMKAGRKNPIESLRYYR